MSRYSRKRPNGFIIAIITVVLLIVGMYLGPLLFTFVLNLPATLIGIVTYYPYEWGARLLPDAVGWVLAGVGAGIAVAGGFWFDHNLPRFKKYLNLMLATEKISSEHITRVYLNYALSTTTIFLGLTMMLLYAGWARGVTTGLSAYSISYALIPVSLIVWAPLIIRFVDGFTGKAQERQELGLPSLADDRQHFRQTRAALDFFGYLILVVLGFVYVVSIPLLILRVSDLVADIFTGTALNTNTIMGDPGVGETVRHPITGEMMMGTVYEGSGLYRIVFALVALGLATGIAFLWFKAAFAVKNQHIRAFWVKVIVAGTILASLNLLIVFAITALTGNTLLSLIFVILAVMIGLGVWRFWSRSWKGKGFSPSVLAGVRNPRPRPGQMWWVTHHGVEKTKIRPAMITGVKGKGRDAQVTFVIMTGGEYAQRNAHNGQYIIVDNQSAVFRGFPTLWKTGDTGYVDVNLIIGHRYDLKNFISNGPRSVYEEICAVYDVEPWHNAAVFNDVNYKEVHVDVLQEHKYSENRHERRAAKREARSAHETAQRDANAARAQASGAQVTPNVPFENGLAPVRITPKTTPKGQIVAEIEGEGFPCWFVLLKGDESVPFGFNKDTRGTVYVRAYIPNEHTRMMLEGARKNNQQVTFRAVEDPDQPGHIHLRHVEINKVFPKISDEHKTEYFNIPQESDFDTQLISPDVSRMWKNIMSLPVIRHYATREDGYKFAMVDGYAFVTAVGPEWGQRWATIAVKGPKHIAQISVQVEQGHDWETIKEALGQEIPIKFASMNQPGPTPHPLMEVELAEHIPQP